MPSEDKEGQTPSDSLGSYMVLWAKGFCMGASDVVPGVSGGTMAFILGIYEELIGAIRSFDLYSLRLALTLKIRSFLEYTRWKFLSAVILGILTAVFSLARLLDWLLINRPVMIWSFFFGLILGSIVTVSRQVKRWNISSWSSLIAGILGAYILVGLVPVSTPNDLWFIFLSGAIAICAMILPGISGSFILVLLGKYQYVLNAVNQRDFVVLLVMALGACAGLAGFARVLSWLFREKHDLIVALLTGLMLGSLRKVWPWKETLRSVMDSGGSVIPIVQVNIFPPLWTSEVTVAVCLMVAGLAVVSSMACLAERKQG
jgi:putative membrane protein